MKPLADIPALRFRSAGHPPAIPLPKGLFAWARRIDGWALFCFASGIYFLHGYGQLRVLGILMLLAFPLACNIRLPKDLRGLWPLPPELKCYTVWVLWTGLTGWLVAADLALFWDGYRVLLQMLVMVWATYAILRNQGQVYAVILAALVGGVVQIAAVASGFTSMKALMVAQERVAGFTYNANSLGFQMNWCALAALMFFRAPGRWRWIGWLVPLVVLPPAAYVMLASGSRKSLVAMVFLIFGWSIFAASPKGGLVSYVKRLIVAGAVIMIFLAAAPFVMQHTPVGARFANFLQEGRGSIQASAEKNVRYSLYSEGIAIFLENPVFGVGLNNFKYYSSSGLYSHSDYMEPLATTGIVGFVLYQAFYFCLLFRIVRLLFRIKDPHTLYWLKLMLLGVATIMLIGFGSPHYTSQPVFVLLTAFSVYTWQLMLRLEAKKNGLAGAGCAVRLPSGTRAPSAFGRHSLKAPRSAIRYRHKRTEFP